VHPAGRVVADPPPQVTLDAEEQFARAGIDGESVGADPANLVQRPQNPRGIAPPQDLLLPQHDGVGPMVPEFLSEAVEGLSRPPGRHVCAHLRGRLLGGPGVRAHRPAGLEPHHQRAQPEQEQGQRALCSQAVGPVGRGPQGRQQAEDGQADQQDCDRSAAQQKEVAQQVISEDQVECHREVPATASLHRHSVAMHFT